MTRRHKVAFLAVVFSALSALLGLGVWAWRSQYWPAHHFSTVRQGVLIRGGQPTAAGWRAIHQQYHLKTVIDLRQDRPDADWALVERDFCRANGIQHVKMPIGAAPTPAQLEQFIRIVTDPQNQPVFVHCEAGSRRTGVMVAAYRILVDGWSVDRAISEYRRFRRDIYPAQEQFLRSLAQRKSSG